MNRSIQKARQIFSDNQGLMRTSEALGLGIAPRTLYAMRNAGLLRRVSRGIYQLADQDFLGNPDLIAVSLRIPRAVICLVSALQFYGLTVQIPHQVDIALPAKSEKPRLEHPPLRIFWLASGPYMTGINIHEIDGILVKIYSIEKTIADCIKFRNRIGQDVMIEALKEYVKLPNLQINNLLQYAQLNRVEKMMRIYLEMLI